MKKSWKYLVGVLFFFVVTPNVYASSCSVSVSAKTITIGQSVTVYVKGSDLIGNIASINASNGKISNISDTWIENSTTTAKFTPSSTGKATISVKLASGTSNGAGNLVNVGCNSVTVTVNSKSSGNSSSGNTSSSRKPPQPKKSTNNNLSSLSLEGYALSPAFDKNTTNYNVTVPFGTKQIQINAYKEDTKASISGDYLKNVVEGENKFDVVVTAENGAKKTYTIHVTVDSKPIIVTLDNKEYTLVKKITELPDTVLKHEEMKLNIEDQEIDAYRISSINYILVGLRDSEGKIGLYKFDSYKGEERMDYTPYQEISMSGMTLISLSNVQDIPHGYKKEMLEINGIEVTAYKSETNPFYLLYAMNAESKYTGWYQYDAEENTLQRYLESKENGLEEYIRPIYIGICAILSLLAALTLAVLKRMKKTKKL